MRSLPVALSLLSLTVAACSGDEDDARPTGEQPPSAAREREPAPRPRPFLPPGRGHLLARVRARVLVHARPGGDPIARLGRETPFGKPRTLAVLETRRRGSWLGIHTPVLGNGRIGWIANDDDALRLKRTRISLRVHLHTRRVTLRRAGRVIRTVPIAIGAAGTDTPVGRFQVTDKLKGSRFPRAPYGCCILALSARQPSLPPGWPGGDRIALHGTPLSQTIGTAASNGCLRAAERDMRVLMRRVPVGARVTIRR